MLKIEFAGFGPHEAEFVFVEAGGDVRVAAGLDVWIDADGDAGKRLDVFSQATGFFEENFEFGGRFDVELENAGIVVAAGAVAKSFSYFVAGFADARENDTIPRNADVPKQSKFTAADDVEAASLLGQ